MIHPDDKVLLIGAAMVIGLIAILAIGIFTIKIVHETHPATACSCSGKP